jgi:hypothetical protein
MTSNPGGITLHERIATSYEEVCSDQVGVDALAFGLEVDPVVHEEFGPVGAGDVPVGKHGVLRVP